MTSTSPVLAALINARVSEIAPNAPRSWDAEARAAFLQLPANLQRYYAKREADRDRAVRKAQNEAADLRHKLAAAEQKLKSIEEQNVENKNAV